MDRKCMKCDAECSPEVPLCGNCAEPCTQPCAEPSPLHNMGDPEPQVGEPDHEKPDHKPEAANERTRIHSTDKAVRVEFLAVLSHRFEFKANRDRIIVKDVSCGTEVAEMKIERIGPENNLIIKGCADLPLSYKLYYIYEVHNRDSNTVRPEYFNVSNKQKKDVPCRVLKVKSVEGTGAMKQFDDAIRVAPRIVFSTYEDWRHKGIATASDCIFDYIQEKVKKVKHMKDAPEIMQMLENYKDCFKKIPLVFADKPDINALDVTFEVYERIERFIEDILKPGHGAENAASLQLIQFAVLALHRLRIKSNENILELIICAIEQQYHAKVEMTDMAASEKKEYLEALTSLCKDAFKFADLRRKVWCLYAVYSAADANHWENDKDPLTGLDTDKKVDSTEQALQEPEIVLSLMATHKELIRRRIPFAEKVLQLLTLGYLADMFVIEMDLPLKSFHSAIRHWISKGQQDEDKINQLIQCLTIYYSRNYSIYRSMEVLLFAVSVLTELKVQLNLKTLDLLVECIQNGSPLDGAFKHLDKSTTWKYIDALIRVCSAGSGSSHCSKWVWLVPVVYTVADQSEHCSSKEDLHRKFNFTALMKRDEVQQEIMKMIVYHKDFVRQCDSFTTTVFQMLTPQYMVHADFSVLDLHPKFFITNIVHRIVDLSTDAIELEQGYFCTMLAKIAEHLKRRINQRNLDPDAADTFVQDIICCLFSAVQLSKQAMDSAKRCPFDIVIYSFGLLRCFHSAEDILKSDEVFPFLVTAVCSDDFLLMFKKFVERSVPPLTRDSPNFLQNTDMWHKVFDTELFTAELTTPWIQQISSIFIEKHEKQSCLSVLSSYQKFISNENGRSTLLEKAFSDLVIKRVKHMLTSELTDIVRRMSEVWTPIHGDILSAIIETVWKEALAPFTNPECFEECVPSILEKIMSSSLSMDILSIIYSPQCPGKIQLYPEAECLITKLYQLNYLTISRVYTGAVPFNVMTRVLHSRDKFVQMQKMLKTDDKFHKLEQVLRVREEEIRHVVLQLTYRESFAVLCFTMKEIIKVELDASYGSDSSQQKQNIEDLVALKRFSDTGDVIIKPSLHSHPIYEMEKTVHNLKESIYFRKLWMKQCESAQQSQFQGMETISLNQVYENIYRPALLKYRETYRCLKEGSISVQYAATQFADILEREQWLRLEFEIMESTQRKRDDGDDANYEWVNNAIRKSMCCPKLLSVFRAAKIISKLKSSLELNGDFQTLDVIMRYEKDFKDLTFNDLTPEILATVKALSTLKEDTLRFLEALQDCVEKQFFTWIKTIMKDKTELSTFVELVSYSAGEDPLKLADTISCRDAISASAPIIFDLSPDTGLKDMFLALEIVNEALEHDGSLPRKLTGACENRKWLNEAYESHGSVERSSVSQAVAINKCGKFVILCPEGILMPSLEHCISLRLPPENVKQLEENIDHLDSKALSEDVNDNEQLAHIDKPEENGDEQRNEIQQDERLDNEHVDEEADKINQPKDCTEQKFQDDLKSDDHEKQIEENEDHRFSQIPQSQGITYSLSQLQELQNKLMLIAPKTAYCQEEVNRFLEILEKVELIGQLYLQLLNEGHILFKHWAAEVYCDEKRKVTLRTDFPIAGVVAHSEKPVLDELRGLCLSMEECLSQWKFYLKTQRSHYPHLNMFTAQQLVHLCSTCKIADFLQEETLSMETQVLNMLSILKHDVTDEDVRQALQTALRKLDTDVMTTEEGLDSLTLTLYLFKFPQLIQRLVDNGNDESVIKATIQNSNLDPNIGEIEVMDFEEDMGENKEEIERLSTLYDKNREEFLSNKMNFRIESQDLDALASRSIGECNMVTSFESLPTISQKMKLLWEAYCAKMKGLVSGEYISLDILGKMLTCLADFDEKHIHRSLPDGLSTKKPNLILCKEEEMLPLMLSVYACTPDAPLPTYDEVLICTPETTKEEIELIIRRSLYNDNNNTKIYCLLSTEKLSYRVAKDLEFLFFHFVQSRSADYRFVIFCDAKAHNSYIITAFDTYKVSLNDPAGSNVENYLKKHLTVSEEGQCTSCVYGAGYQQHMKIVFSQEAGMGKSLFVLNTFEKAKEGLKNAKLTLKTIRLTESDIDFRFIVDELTKFEVNPTEQTSGIFHFDVTPVVSKDLYKFLIQLFILRHLQSPEGTVWKCRKSHLYLVEYLQKGTEMHSTKKHEITKDIEDGFLNIFPVIKCMSPAEVIEAANSRDGHGVECQMMDIDTFRSDAYQRACKYLRKYKCNDNLDTFSFVPAKTERAELEDLRVLLEFCGKTNPSWTEIGNFTHFLNLQLEKCEKSVFCSAALRSDLVGFKAFVIKFIITMAKDFAMPSIEDVTPHGGDKNEFDDPLKRYQLRNRWEHQAHPYIIFHANEHSMEFLGFHINSTFDSVDANSDKILEKRVITKQLYNILERQGVPFNRQYEKLPRTEQLEILSRVFGQRVLQDPDESYRLTLDNTLKMMAIHLRFQANIPVIIMGETGCGKTRLVQFMCKLHRAGKDVENMILVRVHGGTTSKTIYMKVMEAINLAQQNDEQHNLDTVLFFDEANTTEAVFAIKEVMCDKSVNGRFILHPRLKIVAACNPYRQHADDVIKQLENAGLGYRVRSEDTVEKLGYIPFRQLVYRVHPLPPSMQPLVWDFGKLNKETQSLYITEIVKSTITSCGITQEYIDICTSVIATSQQFFEKRNDESRVVSLRDIERCMRVMSWFYHLRDLLFDEIDKKLKNFQNCESDIEQAPNAPIDQTHRSLILAVCVCYYASLQHREDYLEEMSRCFSVPACRILQEIVMCQEVFLDHISLPDKIAKNDALRENIFMMVVCMDLRIPLFLVGKPGSSKSLAKTKVFEAMQGKVSKAPLFAQCKELYQVSFQCSPHSKSEAIIATFRHSAQFQKNKNLKEFASVVVLDEVGLAEDSPQMPLKALHPLLEDGCVDEETAEEYKKVGFIGISNWSLDPAKMNRGLLVMRNALRKEELVKTAHGMCAGAEADYREIQNIFPNIADVYLDVLKNQRMEFFGLRDYYSVIKTILSYTKEKKHGTLWKKIAKAILRNFGGLDEMDPMELFYRHINLPSHRNENIGDTLTLLQENLDKEKSGFESRYLLLLTSNHAALQIIQMKHLIDINDCDIIYGSGFPKDQEYSQVCRSVNRVKNCMETGRHVILLNIQNLYESLYDALNQCFVTLSDNYYVDLGLGTHRVKCRVKDNFRLIVIENKSIVYKQFPTPLLNRLEKHILEMDTILDNSLKPTKETLDIWTQEFVKLTKMDYCIQQHAECTLSEHDVFIGFSNDSCAAALLQSSQECNGSQCNLSLSERNKALEGAKCKLTDCATPDAVLRLNYTDLMNKHSIHELYFAKQKHNGLIEILSFYLANKPQRVLLEVSTHSRLLNQSDEEAIQNAINLHKSQICCHNLSQFDTEHDFRRVIRTFLKLSSAEKIFLVQCNLDEPEKSARLHACAKFCITDEMNKTEAQGAVIAVMITRVPQILGGCSYVAFSGGEWHSLHLDDLLVPHFFSANLGDLSGMTISALCMNKNQQQRTNHGVNEDSTENEESKHADNLPVQLINTQQLIKQCIQKAVIQLSDNIDNAQRTTKRIEIICHLLEESTSSEWVCSNFAEVIKNRICTLLQEREENSPDPRNWICRQALLKYHVLEGSSFRHALWIHLEDVVADSFAQVLAAIDANKNLDHLSDVTKSPSSTLWINMFKDDSFLKISYVHRSSDTKISVPSTISDPLVSAKCSFPFSWILRELLDQVWAQTYQMKESPKEPTLDCAELFISLMSSNKKTFLCDVIEDLAKRYSDDFVRLAYPGQCQDIYDILSSVLKNGAEQLYKDKTKQDIIHQPLIWIHIQYFYFKDTYQIFMDFLKSEESLSERLVEIYKGKSSETRVELSAASIILDMLEPREDILLPFDKCLDWLKRIKSFKHLVAQIPSGHHRLPYTESGKHMLKTITDRWYYMKSIYLLIDHLLHDECSMDEKFLRIAMMRVIFLWTKFKKILNQRNITNIFEHVTNELKKMISRAINHYFLKGASKCKICKNDIKTPAELPCGHIFCFSCITDRPTHQCPECRKGSGEDFIPKEMVIAREAIESYNKFITSCNSFFVEFVSTYCFTEHISLSTEVIDNLIKFVAYKPPESKSKGPQTDYKSVSEVDLSNLEACMNPSPMVKYNILSMLLQCRTDAVQAKIENYISTMENASHSNINDYSDFYYMVVRCVEDFVHTSRDEDDAKPIEEHLSVANLSLLTSDDVSTFHKLKTIARLRFALSAAATVIGQELKRDEKNTSMLCIQQSEESRRLVESLRSLLGTSATPWLRTFLIRILHAEHGFGILKSILHQETWHWILPPGINVAEMKAHSFSDNFLIYGAVYNDLTIKSLRNGDENQSFLLPYFEEIQGGSSDKLMYLAVAATRDLFNKKASDEAKILEAILRQQDQYPALSHIAPVCKALHEKQLTGGFGKLSYTEIAHLVEVIIHAVLVIITAKAKLKQLLKSICLDPSTIRESYLPTMPEDDLFAANQMKKTKNETFWACSCGEVWLLENCGQPWVIGKCKCGTKIGGEYHKAVDGFTEIDISTDKTEKGYLLDGPETRKAEEQERNLTASSFCISRVLLHASMLWGSLTDEQSIRKVMKVEVQNLSEFFCGHLQKDIEFLAKYIGGNTDDAVLAIHLFLKFIFNNATEIDLNIESTDKKDSRNKWEDCLKSTIQTFFQGFESTLNSAKQQITEHGPPALLKIIHSQASLSHDFQNTELVNMNYIWRYEKGRTVEHLKHLLDQEDGKNSFPLLMELLTEKNISYIKQLPDILHFQLYLIRLFQSCDLLKWKGKSIGQFLDSSDVADEQRSAFKGAFRTIQRVWIHIRGTGGRAPNKGAINELNDDSPMQALLPTNESVPYGVALFLIALQNRLIDMAISITKERKKIISAAEVKLSSVISCVPEKEVVPLALSNIQYVLDEDGTPSALYNFRALQRQVMNEYISGKPAVNPQTVPVITLNEMTMNSTIKTVKEQMKIQVPLSASAIKRIMEEVKSVSDVSSVLAALKVAAEFLAVMGGDPESLITTYIREQLKMSNEVKHFKALPVVPQSQLKHILSLWQILLARRSVLLVEMNQNPFFFMASDFQEDLTPEEEAVLTNKLSTVNIDDFVLELHEMIMICQEIFCKDYGIAVCFSHFLTEKHMDEARVETLTSALDPELEMKKILAVWKMAVKVRKRDTSQH